MKRVGGKGDYNFIFTQDPSFTKDYRKISYFSTNNLKENLIFEEKKSNVYSLLNKYNLKKGGS